FSRYRFETNENIDIGDGLTVEALAPQDPDSVMNERMTIRLDGQMVALYNIHLTDPVGAVPHVRLPVDFPGLQGVLHYNDRPRNTEITTWLAKLETDSNPYRVAAASNISDQSVTYQQLRASMGDPFRVAGPALAGSSPAP